MIPVTKPFMPPKEEYLRYLNGIWEREYLTNNGPLVQQLEKELKEYLKVPNILYVSNGTIALQIAIKALGLKGEVITTPFSYVATTSSLVWENCEPVFVDIDPETLNIDPNRIEEAITENTTGILATHVFGNPCDIDAIQAIADKYGLKVIYDAAHCFAVTYKGRSIYEFGDISTASFHATKIFHTVEGGAVFTNNEALHKKMKYMRNFGHAGEESFKGVGINGKNSELHAAMGLANLKYSERILENRQELINHYSELMKDIYSDNPEVTMEMQLGNEFAEWNYSYLAVMFEDEASALRVKGDMEKEEIYPRRYFYPSLESLDYVRSANVRISQDIASRILCLPLYYGMKLEEIERVCQVMQKSLNLVLEQRKVD